MAGGSIFFNKLPFLKFGASLAHAQAFAGESPIPEKLAHVTTRIQNGVFLLKNEVQEQIILNDVGTIIWRHIDGKRTCKQLANILTGEFHIDGGMASKDVEAFVHQLEEDGFLWISKIARCYSVEKAVCKKRSIVSAG